MKGIVFDLYNTLVQSPGFRNVTSVILPGIPHAEISKIIYAEAEGSSLAMLTRLSKHFGVARTNTELRKDVALCTEWASERKFFPGTLETLRELRRRGFKLGLLSNTSELLDATLEANGIPKLLDHLVLSHLIRCQKPKEAAFRAIIEKMEIKPQDLTMVGDILRVDIIPANAIGMQGIQLSCPWEEQGEVTISQIEELLTLPQFQRPS